MINKSLILPQESNSIQLTDAKLLNILSDIKNSIAEIDDISELLSIKHLASGYEKAWEGYYKATGFGREQMMMGFEANIRASKKMGELLEKMEKNKGVAGGGERNTAGFTTKLADETQTLEDLGITKNQSFRYQKIADLPDETIEKIFNEMRVGMKEPSTSNLFKTAHVSYNSGEDEWYTPPEIIELARKTMGSIEFDPASSEEANKIVQAKTYLTFKDDGLKTNWFGNVWMNPPFSQIPEFTSKLVDEYKLGNIKQACAISLNGTETQWCQYIMQNCKVVCFPKGRIKFLDKDRKPHTGSPLQGNIIFYFGDNPENFEKNFKEIGTILWHKI